MKIIKKEQKFEPITVVLENKEELFHLLTLLNASINEIRKLYNQKIITTTYDEKEVFAVNDFMFNTFCNNFETLYREWRKTLRTNC